MHTMSLVYWKLDDKDIPEEIVDKAVEHMTEFELNSGDDFYADYDGHFPDPLDKLFNHPRPKYWDLDRGNYIQFHLSKPEGMKNYHQFMKWLGVPKKLGEKVNYDFMNMDEQNTTLEWECLEVFNEKTEEYEMAILTEDENSILQVVTEKFDDMIHDALINLRENWEYLMYDRDHHIDMAIANDWCFDEDGSFVYPDSNRYSHLVYQDG